MLIIKTQDYQLINVNQFVTFSIYELEYENSNQTAYAVECKLANIDDEQQVGIYDSSEEAIEVINRLTKWLSEKYSEPVFKAPATGFMSKSNPD